MPKNVKSSCFDSIQRFLRAAAARIGFRPSSRGDRAVLRSASGVIPYLLRPSARSPPLPSFPLTFSCLSAYFLLGKIAFSLPASFPPRTWIGFLWLLPYRDFFPTVAHSFAILHPSADSQRFES